MRLAKRSTAVLRVRCSGCRAEQVNTTENSATDAAAGAVLATAVGVRSTFDVGANCR